MPELLVHDSPISYRTCGSGEPVMLLHGGGSNGRQWMALVSELGDHRLCLLPDFHGHGASPPWLGILDPSLGDYAAIVEALENIVGRPFHLVGHSHGGAVAITYAVQHPEALRSLTLIEPTLMHLLRAVGSSDAWREARDLGHKHIKAIAEGKSAEIADEFLPYWIGDAAWHAMSEERRAPIIATMPAVAQFWSSVLKASTATDHYASMRAPTLLIRGTETRLPAHEVVDLLHEILPNSRMREIEGAGHMAPLTHPVEVNAAIADHISAHSRAQASAV